MKSEPDIKIDQIEKKEEDWLFRYAGNDERHMTSENLEYDANAIANAIANIVANIAVYTFNETHGMQCRRHTG